MDLVLKLSLPFLSVSKVLELWECGRVITDDMVCFFIVECFKLKNGVEFSAKDGVFKTDNSATWDRIFNREKLLDRIINNKVMDRAPRLKTRIYLGVKRNDTRLLHYYYKNYDVIKGKSSVLFPISNANDLLPHVPTVLGNRCVSVRGSDIIITDSENGVLVGVINCKLNTVYISDAPNNRDLEFLLKSPNLFLDIYKPSNKRKVVENHEHRRPKIRRRLTTE